MIEFIHCEVCKKARIKILLAQNPVLEKPLSPEFNRMVQRGKRQVLFQH
ncbi:hypothetical protein OHJ28_09715 [Dickeya fangzhongdai]